MFTVLKKKDTVLHRRLRGGFHSKKKKKMDGGVAGKVPVLVRIRVVTVRRWRALSADRREFDGLCRPEKEALCGSSAE
jgi:hypothetical protein